MSVILSIQQNILYFEESMRTQLKTQESEMREQLKTQETEIRAEKVKNITNTRIVEELRPLCEEVPPDALDPVTMEPFEEPLLYGCGHAFDLSTIMNIAKANHLGQQDLLECPKCRKSYRLRSFFTPLNLIGCTDAFKRISQVFKRHK